MDHLGDGSGAILRRAGLSVLAALLAGGAVTAAILGVHRPAAGPVSSAAPPARSAAAMAEDPAHGDVVLFGGQGASGLLDDTWLWNGSSWSEARPAHNPPPRYGAQLAWDPRSHRDILLGGMGGPDCSGPAASSATGSCGWLDSAWAWNGSDWSQLSLGPLAGHSLAGAEMATDPAQRSIVLLTSADAPSSGGVATRRVTAAASAEAAACPLMPANPPTAVTPPACPALPCLALGVPSRVCLTPPPLPTPPAQPTTLTWTFDGTNFHEVSTGGTAGGEPPLGGHLVWFSSIRRLADLAWMPQPEMGSPFHSEIACVQGRPCPGLPRTVWEWDGARWSDQALARAATMLPVVAAAAADAAHNDVVALDSTGATWVSADPAAGWTRIAAPAGPGPRSGEALAEDTASGAVVLFGGAALGAPSPGAAADDTWTWDGRHWSHRGGAAPSPTPIGNRVGPPSFVSGQPGPIVTFPAHEPNASPGALVLASPGAHGPSHRGP
jgi:hypothetical protein